MTKTEDILSQILEQQRTTNQILVEILEAVEGVGEDDDGSDMLTYMDGSRA